MTLNPFEVLGLPARPDLDDETVRAAWRQIAAATHPDRPDGGDLARYTQASTAYAELRTPWGRSEAYADLAEADRRQGRFDDYPGSDPGTDPSTLPLPAIVPGDLPSSAPPWQPLLNLAWLPSRIARGRPGRLLIRAAIAAGLSLAVLILIPGQPAVPADVAGLVVWFVLTGRKYLAPPPER
jgi:curved DNA-binding protein CbpA